MSCSKFLRPYSSINSSLTLLPNFFKISHDAFIPAKVNGVIFSGDKLFFSNEIKLASTLIFSLVIFSKGTSRSPVPILRTLYALITHLKSKF